jgi:hypothetical protein
MNDKKRVKKHGCLYAYKGKNPCCLKVKHAQKSFVRSYRCTQRIKYSRLYQI